MSILNIADSLRQLAEDIPDTPAIIVDRSGRTMSFAELHHESDRLASGLSRLGVSPGNRILLMVPFGIDFIALTFALFKTGAVCILIDPGLGKKNVLQCIREAEPHGMIAIPLAHAVRKLYPIPFSSVRFAVTVGTRWFWGGHTLTQVRKAGSDTSIFPAITPDDPAAILFTSGSTGPPKGVLYTHTMFFRQMSILRDYYGITQGEVDLPTFPLFGLFGVGLGMTCVIPEMDFTRPAKVVPQNIIRAVTRHRVTSSFGSPALWNAMTRYCVGHQARLASLKRILIAGAPVPGHLLKRFENVVGTDCTIHTPYGATEALPVATIDHHEILGETWEATQRGGGTCVGKPIAGAEVKIIKISDSPISTWNTSLEVAKGQTGEIVVRAPWVTRAYHNRDADTQRAKIMEGNSFYHRMGDIGRLDEQGRLWFLGRKNQRVVTLQETLFTIPCEAVFNTHPQVNRSALVGIGERGSQRPVIIIETTDRKHTDSEQNREKLRQELLKLGSEHAHTQSIHDILFHAEFPVDVRHNAKIFREKLADWAREQR